MINIDNHDKSLLGFAGSGFGESPNIDNLYDKGVYLANYQCASRCGPSRTALMTGRYHIRSGHIQTPDGRSVMGDTSVPTVANLFQDAGYKTAMYGKWHIGKNYPYRPEDRGFDEVVTFFQGRLSKTGRGPHTVRHNGKWEEFEGYRIDLWFNELGKFIKKNRTKPFMAYLATWATHGGNFGPDDLSKKYRRKMDSLGEKTAKLFKDKETKYNYAETAAEIESIDRNIGRLTALLNQLGLREDTIIVYTSDGAGFRTPAGLMRKDAKEFPSKVPAIIYWPGGNLNRDTDVTQLVANIDMAPTLLDMCGIDQSEKVKFDGQSAYSLFSPKGAKWKDRIYIADHQSRNGVREGFLKPLDYTNVHFPSGACVSFRKGKAKGASPEMEAAARKHWGAWWKDVTADFKPYHHVIVGTKHENPTIVYQVYTGLNEQKAKVKNYVFAIEFAVAGKYRFGGGRRKSKGYLKIGDKTHTGEFPMTLKLPAGKKMVIVSFDGQKRSGGLTIEWLADEDSQ
ncbi:MAG: sulfatase-like hydrolase/transferase [Phycisphaerae bacterium]|jgi:arylsulfatase A-like enzyme|nr:sulfatase-like hydrolase/transferase [Phycisphaerae bacterium]